MISMAWQRGSLFVGASPYITPIDSAVLLLLLLVEQDVMLQQRLLLRVVARLDVDGRGGRPRRAARTTRRRRRDTQLSPLQLFGRRRGARPVGSRWCWVDRCRAGRFVVVVRCGCRLNEGRAASPQAAPDLHNIAFGFAYFYIIIKSYTRSRLKSGC